MPKRKNQRGRHETANTDDDSFQMYRWEFPESGGQQGQTSSLISSFAGFVKGVVGKIRRAMVKDTHPSSR